MYILRRLNVVSSHHAISGASPGRVRWVRRTHPPSDKKKKKKKKNRKSSWGGGGGGIPPTELLCELKFSRWFYFCEFRESNPRENVHLKSSIYIMSIFIVLTTSVHPYSTRTCTVYVYYIIKGLLYSGPSLMGGGGGVGVCDTPPPPHWSGRRYPLPARSLRSLANPLPSIIPRLIFNSIQVIMI